MCDVCHEKIKASPLRIKLVCNDCFNKDIKEFLKDWRWGRAYELHFSWLNYYDHCRCKPSTIGYWKWFEEKWEKKVNNNAKN